MPRVKSIESVCKSILEKQLRFIEKKDPKEVTPVDINLALSYFKEFLPKPESSEQSALADITTEDLMKVVNGDQ